MKAIVLARVSTEEQKEAGNSLPAQQARLERYCLGKGLEIEKVISFDESAYKTKREEFSKVLEELKNAKEPKTLCCDKIDRLIRNFTADLVTLEELRKSGKLELHFPSDNIILHKDSPATDLFRFTMGVSLAKYFSDSISDNVKRATEQKLRNREWPGRAPVGYRNIDLGNDKRDIEVDPVASQRVRSMFEWYATGAYSIRLIRAKLKEEFNVSYHNGYVDDVLDNSFYYGEMLWKGKLYPHKYPPLISRTLYEKVKTVRAGYHKQHFKFAGLPYVYRGLIHCADCGCMVTPEKAKDRYVYYHCTQYNGKHGAEWLREEEITKQFAGIYRSIEIPPDVVQDILSSLKASHQGKIDLYEATKAGLEAQHQQLEKRIERMYEDRLDGRITESFYDEKYQQYRDEQKSIESKLANLTNADENYYLTASYLLNLASRAAELFESSEPEQKRLLLKLTLQNLRLEGKTVCYEAQKPFDQIFNLAGRRLWLPR